MEEFQQSSLEKTLMNWCRQSTEGYSHVDIKNFTTSWRDGYAFNALIHKYRPDLFRYEDVMMLNNDNRLDHAFRVAYDILGIDKLLDAEDVNCDQPDKKSIMMYLMCYFQVLPHQHVKKEKVSSQLQIASTDISQEPLSVTKQPLSVTKQTTVSRKTVVTSTVAKQQGVADLTRYQADLETVLTWLLQAEDTLRAQQPISDDVDKVKEQFHAHEEFMMELTAHQGNVGAVLQEGNYHIVEGRITEEEENEIREQMGLLNSRWEHLRVDSMQRQSSLHEKLMKLQQRQLDELDDWLTCMEQKIKQQNTISSNLEDIKKQVQRHKDLQEELVQVQVQVNSLTHMVVVVDENSPEN
uniref:Utrophin-like n=1 Tax=Saccoglossus kowalevskii TaxID=10224 RepID=A0ABM0MHJ1_SACKO